MRAYDIIAKKRDNHELSEKEIQFLIDGYISGDITDYQMAAFLMAVYFSGMTDLECQNLTRCMINSGDVIDLSPIEGIKVDKHSTGGVGDKTTLIVTPIVAACGVKVAKMSGRGLGHTGGTIDKLESIPGINVELSEKEFFDAVNNVGCCVVSQTGNLVPADKKIYALRDVTATVESMPLIASSIMSKKIASGADCIVLDVKTGSGAFMKTKEDAIKLSEIMVKIGKGFGRKVVAIITDMDKPLGHAIGNALEVEEVCDVLKGNGPQDLKDISVYLAANMLFLAGKGNLEDCKIMAASAISSGKAFQKFREMILAQGGNISKLGNKDCFNSVKIKYEIKSEKTGFITSMDTEKLGICAMILGAGREKKGDKIDYNAGIILNKKTGDFVNSGETLAWFYSSHIEKCISAEKLFGEVIKLGENISSAAPLIQARVTANKTEILG